LIAERNETFTQIDPWAEDIAEQLARRDKQGQVPVQTPDFLKALEIPQERWSPQASSRVRQIAESRGWHVARKQVGGVRVKGLWPPCHTSCHPCHTDATQTCGSEIVVPDRVLPLVPHMPHINPKKHNEF